MEAKGEEETGWSIQVVSVGKRKRIRLDEKSLQQSVQSFIEEIGRREGQTPRIYLYESPPTHINKLYFIHPKTRLVTVLSQFPQLCCLHNNIQFTQSLQSLPFIEQPSKECMMVIFQSSRNDYFAHQTFKLSADCKILFLKSLASNYGRNASVIYYGFRISLEHFGKNQSIKDVLTRFLYPGKHLIIGLQENDSGQYFKSVLQKEMIDSDKFWVVEMQQSKRYVPIDRRSNLQAIDYIFTIIFQSQMKIVDKDQKCCDLSCIQGRKDKEWRLVRKTEQRSYLQCPVVNCIYLGSTSQFICFVEQSHVLHVYSNRQPYSLINSVILNCLPCNQLQEQIPLLVNQKVLTYQITRFQVTIKNFSLPLGTLTHTQHQKWYSNQYGPIICASLDLFGVSLVGRNRSRIFYIYDSQDYYQIDCAEKYWDMWVSRHAMNNFSDGSGIFGIYNLISQDLSIHNFSKREIMFRMKCQKPQNVVFCSKLQMMVVRLIDKEHTCVQYSFGGGERKVIGKYSVDAHQVLCYSPCGNKFVLGEKNIKYCSNGGNIRIGKCLMKEGNVFFSKDGPNLFHQVSYIHALEKDDGDLT